ncbi:MAG: CHASE2 domain-containing protein [Candidatus Riflebacteria bacterium]|nr:CHASE2 domain-containing protein [Candidatus Riflebacteria bacterium]
MRRKSLLAKILVLVVIWLGVGWVSGLGGLRFLEGPQDELFWRIRWRVRPGPAEPPRVFVFPIDLKSVETLKSLEDPHHRTGFLWPLPHRYYAQAIRRLSSLGVKAIGFDIQFADWALSSDSADLAAAIASSSAPVVVAGQIEKGVGMSLDAADQRREDNDGEGYDFDQATTHVEREPASWAGIVFGAGMVNFDKDVNAGETILAHPLVFSGGDGLQPSLALQLFHA